MIYLRFEYVKFPSLPQQPDDFIGPFPEAEFAAKHKALYGPVAATVVRLDTPPDPDHTMTPGEAVDYVLARW